MGLCKNTLYNNPINFRSEQIPNQHLHDLIPSPALWNNLYMCQNFIPTDLSYCSAIGQTDAGSMCSKYRHTVQEN